MMVSKPNKAQSMKKLLIFICLASLFSACREKSTLEQEVIAVHDEVMPKLGELNKDRRNLQDILKNTTDENVKAELLQAITALEKADDGMMDWMADWKVPSNMEEQKPYLEKEMIRIKKVKTDMLESMENAKILKEKYTTK
jgi:hypothetical protein